MNYDIDEIPQSNIDEMHSEMQTAMHIIRFWCNFFKTCKRCKWAEEHKGCYFRQFKTPREWKIDEDE